MDRLNLLLACAAVRLCVCASPLVAQTDDGAQRIAQSLIPAVERAVGLTFKRPPAIAVRSREQVRQFLMRKIATEYPPAELDATTRTYRALRLVPDSLDLSRLMLDLYSEQVAGFFDPDSSKLFIVRGSDAQTMRLVMAHELVHALQDQYTRLNAILKMKRQNDRQRAGQAVMEGQAMFASVSVIADGQQLDPRMWDRMRGMIREQQAAMPVFATAPRILQESMLFPYVGGGEFMQAFYDRRSRPDEQPFGDRLPVSTEQILHFSRYTAGEVPARITIGASPGDTLIYDDDLGEFEIRVALESWGASVGVSSAAASGWNGDRYSVFGTRAGTALVWAVGFDTPADALEFERAVRTWFTRAGQGRADSAGRRTEVELMEVSGVKVVRLVDAPAAWSGWRRLPRIVVSPPAAR